jgi:hypothetical protein
MCAHCKGEVVEKIDFAFQIWGATRKTGLTHDELMVLMADVTTSMLQVSDKSASPSTVQVGLLVDDCFVLANRDLTEAVQRQEFIQWIATLLEFSEGDEYTIDTFMRKLSEVDTCVERQKLQLQKEREKVLGLDAPRPQTGGEAQAKQLKGSESADKTRPSSAPIEFTLAGSSVPSATSLLGPGGVEAGGGTARAIGGGGASTIGKGAKAGAKAGAADGESDMAGSHSTPSTPKMKDRGKKEKGKKRKESKEGMLFSPTEQQMENAVEARNERQTGIRSPEKTKAKVGARQHASIEVLTLQPKTEGQENEGQAERQGSEQLIDFQCSSAG